MTYRICRIALLIFTLLYAGALLLFLIGTFGWFGQERDPLSGVFVIPLGLPWNLMLDAVADPVRAWAAAAAPLLNVLLLGALCTRPRAPH
jgi:hypothetical protein